MFSIIRKYRRYLLIGLPILLVVLYFVFGRGKSGTETYVVNNANITQSVILSGKVETSDKADLGFAVSGRLAKIFIKNNQSVTQGQILAQLEINDLLADLKIKELNSKTSSVDLEHAKQELEKVTKQENTKVESTYQTLLTDDLELIPDSNDYNVASPTLGGVYSGLEGQYKISIDKKNITLSDFTLHTFNLEKTNRIINKQGSTLLGTKGLYISFPLDPDLSSYNDTIWFLDIPNKASSSYGSNLNAYNEAKDERDLAIKNAESAYEKLLTENDGGDSIALAEIQKINAEIRKNTIYAPFDGKVTNIEKEVGENANIGERIISILGENKLEIVLQVSELDVSKLVPGSSIKISLDAIPGEEFSGILKTVNSKETEIDGVPVYEAFVELESDPRIKNGMNADGIIILANKENILAIPSYLIKKVGNLNFVNVVLDDGSITKRELILGLMGTNSMVEIISGLNAGEKVVTNANEK